MRSVLTAVCGFTMLASCWLFVMFLILRHPGYEWRAVLSLGFVGIGALTLTGLWLPQPGTARRVAIGGAAVALGVVGAWAIKTNVDEGFVAVIGLAFIVQAALTVTYLLMPRHGRGLQQVRWVRRVRQVR
jgi:hypothetical protein